MNMQNHYLSRGKVFDTFGGYAAIPEVVRTTLKEMFETEGQPRRIEIHGHKTAVLFDRNPTRPKQLLVKVENRFGLFVVNDDLSIVSGKEFMEHVDKTWRKPD